MIFGTFRALFRSLIFFLKHFVGLFVSKFTKNLGEKFPNTVGFVLAHPPPPPLIKKFQNFCFKKIAPQLFD
jgi:hypothetical protein